MDSSIHAHLIAQYAQDRLAEAELARKECAAKRELVRLPRIAWLHSSRGLRRRPRPA